MLIEFGVASMVGRYREIDGAGRYKNDGDREPGYSMVGRATYRNVQYNYLCH